MTIRFDDIPFDKIVKFGQETMLDKNLFSISWILGRFCNYSCSYCWPYANSKTPDHQELSVYINSIEQIKLQANDNGFTNFHWSFSGGEPTAYKHLLSLIEHVGTDSIHMTTNLSPGKSWWDRYLQTSSECRRRTITASFHHEFADENEFADKILYLMDNGVFVTINQVMVPELFDEIYFRCLRFANKGINVTLKPQSDPTASHVVDGYTSGQLEILRNNMHQFLEDEDLLQIRLIDNEQKVWFLDQAERFNSFGFNKFKGWMCNSGYQGIVIRSDEVKRSYSCSDPILGTLSGGFKIFKSPVVCTTNSCLSSADSKLPKVRNV